MKKRLESERPEARNFSRASSRELAKTEKMTSRSLPMKWKRTLDERVWVEWHSSRAILCASGSIHRSRGRSTEICRQETEISTCTRSEQMRRRDKTHGLELEFAAVASRRRRRAVTECCAAAQERVEDEVAFVGGSEEDAFEEGEGLLGGMFAEFFLPGFGGRNVPDGFHLFAAGGFLHQLVIEGVAALFVFGGPDDGFGGVGEIAAGEIGRRIGLDPGDVVEDLEAELLHGEADGMDDVAGAADPDGAVGLEDALAGGEPGAVEFMVGVGAAGMVPFAFVDADHAAGVAGDAAVGEEIGRVGEDEVDGVFGNGGEDFEAIALVDRCDAWRRGRRGRGEAILADFGAKAAGVKL